MISKIFAKNGPKSLYSAAEIRTLLSSNQQYRFICCSRILYRTYVRDFENTINILIEDDDSVEQCLLLLGLGS